MAAHLQVVSPFVKLHFFQRGQWPRTSYWSAGRKASWREWVGSLLWLIWLRGRPRWDTFSESLVQDPRSGCPNLKLVLRCPASMPLVLLLLDFAPTSSCRGRCSAEALAAVQDEKEPVLLERKRPRDSSEVWRTKNRERRTLPALDRVTELCRAGSCSEKRTWLRWYLVCSAKLNVL